MIIDVEREEDGRYTATVAGMSGTTVVRATRADAIRDVRLLAIQRATMDAPLHDVETCNRAHNLTDALVEAWENLSQVYKREGLSWDDKTSIVAVVDFLAGFALCPDEPATIEDCEAFLESLCALLAVRVQELW